MLEFPHMPSYVFAVADDAGDVSVFGSERLEFLDELGDGHGICFFQKELMASSKRRAKYGTASRPHASPAAADRQPVGQRGSVPASLYGTGRR